MDTINPSSYNVTLKQRFKSPFKGSPSSTFFRRPSFSPDNTALAVSNACNGGAPVVMILDVGEEGDDVTEAIEDVGGQGKKESGKRATSTDKKEAASISLVGHVTPIEVVSFSPFAYHDNKMRDVTDSMDQMKEDMNHVNYLIAVGTQDGSLSLWSNGRDRPVMVLDGIFEHTVLDLAWTADGMGVVAVSYDGYAVMIKLSADVVERHARWSAPQGRH